MSKPVYLGLSILEISKTVIYEFWYDYIKPKYLDKASQCYMDTDTFTVNIKMFIKTLQKMLKQNLILETM